ncbi:MAG: heavy-metal-associated domain-containing protein [Candidatus Diapherotrites archaeon]|uniref:Heavy-metal-associated domain-containing protein n=1 Tax=Candidatus Iainarchaeum sp. TaxID=3101447 RepID=A0A8T4L693_9ARCH|nr:heavy-metal-associated domain-containing protein [Candidatus Diapherotrites archaeon]
MKTVFSVSGMHCKSCIAVIKMNVGDLNGISEVSGDPDKGWVSVGFDEKKTRVEDIVKKIEQDGYKVTRFEEKK